MVSETIKTPVKSLVEKQPEASKTLIKNLKSATKNNEHFSDKKKETKAIAIKTETLPRQIFPEKSESMVATESAHMQLKE